MKVLNIGGIEMNNTIKKVLQNLIGRMIEENIELHTVNIMKSETALIINGEVYVDIENVEKGTFSTGLVFGENYTLSTEENLEKVIELLKPEQTKTDL